MKAKINRTGGVEILIAEDSATQREQLKNLLQENGFSVVASPNGRMALEAARRSKPTLIITDIVMPELDGYGLCKAIKSDETLKGIPVVLVTTLSDAHDVILGLECGADCFIRKPYDEHYLSLQINNLIMNRELRKGKAIQMGIEITLGGQRHFITADRQQILDLLISTYEQATHINEEFQAANRELRETQSQLVQAAKMASLGQLVAGVAHEINNPLAYVMSHQQTIQRNLDDVMTEVEQHVSVGARVKLDKLRRRLVDSRTGLDRIEELVGKLRTFSRLDDGELKRVNVEENIDAVIALLQHKLKNRIVVHRKFNAGKCLQCYPGPLNQVFMNVISNAIDAIDGRGEISITTRQTDSDFLISITDTGRGIPEPDRQHIFDPFFTTKSIGEGTGLGLSISYGIVKRHNGSLDVHSEVGKGTEIIIRIPTNLAGPEHHAGEIDEQS